MKRIKASTKEKAMDEAISETRRPYDYRITAKKLDEAARESHEYLKSIGKKRKDP